MHKILYALQIPLLWSVILLCMLFYPMLISIYVFLPLLIGVMGYILMKGIDEGKIHYIVVSILYLINLEVNLSLPFFLTIIVSLLVYVLFFVHFRYFSKCHACKAFLSIFLINSLYLGALLAYDFLFQTNSIVIDNVLFYTLFSDLLLVVLV